MRMILMGTDNSRHDSKTNLMKLKIKLLEFSSPYKII